MFSSYFSVKTAISDAEKFDLRAFFTGDAIFNNNVTSDFFLKRVINYKCSA